MPRRCIMKCPPVPGVRFHVFPSLEHKPEHFKAWVQAIGGKLDTAEDYQYYKNQRICDRHFSDECKNRNNRVGALGVPTLYLNESFTGDTDDISNRNTSSCLAGPPLDINEPSTSGIRNEESVMRETDDIINRDSSSCSAGPPLDLDLNKPSTSGIRNEVTMKRRNSVPARKYNKYQRQIKQLRRTVNKLKKREDNFKTRLENAEKMSNTSAFKRITKNMTLPAKIFTDMQFRTTSKKPSGRRFKLEEKVLSLLASPGGAGERDSSGTVDRSISSRTLAADGRVTHSASGGGPVSPEEVPAPAAMTAVPPASKAPPEPKKAIVKLRKRKSKKQKENGRTAKFSYMYARPPFIVVEN